MRSLIILFITIFLAACDWRSSARPSILIIAVEGLNSDFFFCGENDSDFTEGLGALCGESVRFTHAFAPSTMSQASLVSLMTGRYPTETGVVHNGTQYLSEKYVTAAEVALDQGYRTSFFSGGAPIWSKSGIDQGFELFEDNLNVSISKPYRSAEQNFNYFLNWHDEQNNGGPFFSVIYLSDLQYPQFVTTNDHGQERALSRESQLREINESFANFIFKLKQKKIWDNTYVIFTGLNGMLAESRENEIVTTNLHGEGTQVLLLIKAARKPRDLGINWAIDANVTLVDVGETLFDILTPTFHIQNKNEPLEVVSLLPALLKAQVDWPRDRLILIESAWAAWRGVGSTRFAIRKDNILYIQDEAPQIYNTLTDRFETQPFRSNEKLRYPAPTDIQNFFSENKLQPWSGLPSGLAEKIILYQKIVLHQDAGRIQSLIQQRPWDKQLIGWLAQQAIEKKDWALLEELGLEHLYPMWVYIARRMKGEKLQPPQNVCWDMLFKKNTRVDQNIECNDKEFNAFIDYELAASGEQKMRLAEKLMRQYAYAEIDERLARLNFQNGLGWDINVTLPAEPRLIKLALLLAEYKAIRLMLESNLKRY